MRRLHRLCVLLVAIVLLGLNGVYPGFSDADAYLAQGDQALASDSNQQAIGFYQKGIQLVQEDEDNDISLLTILSLYTNLATALSAQGFDEPAAEAYQKALTAYKEIVPEIVDKTIQQEAASIAAQSAFFLGMVYQDLEQTRDAIDAYTYAHKLDPLHWASLANLGSLLHDKLSDHSGALLAYNQAFTILTEPNAQGEEPTDPPAEPRYILSQLQYRIGLCLNQDTSRACVVPKNHDDDDDDDSNKNQKAVDCRQLAPHAFSMAVEYDSTNEPAKHMLATVTADATMKRASNTYITSLFDDYASNFEHSLVKELGYTGYERLRRAFDRALRGGGGDDDNDDNKQKVPFFDLVVDAGCGTGLVGEQFRNVSHTLVGVDLSAAILAQAEQARPGLYNETRVGDVMAVFQGELAGRISLIVAADSYIYFGDLVPLFEAMYEGLRPGGYVAFTLENVDEESEKTLAESKPDWRWQLTASGRFAHRKSYVESISVDHGFTVFHYEPLDGFRYEQGAAVRGHAFILQKPESEDSEPEL